MKGSGQEGAEGALQSEEQKEVPPICLPRTQDAKETPKPLAYLACSSGAPTLREDLEDYFFLLSCVTEQAAKIK